MHGPVLFDLDGCLVDSTPVITACLDHALVAVAGHAPRDPASLRWVVGPPLLHSLERLLGPDASPADVTACLDVYRARYREVAGAETAVFDGMPALVDALRAEGRCVAVVTSKPQALARWLVDVVGLGGRFDAVHGPCGSSEGEPKTVTLPHALASLDIDAHMATMVGDRHHDIEAGRRVGTATIGVTWGAGDRAELEAAGADLVVDAVDELAAALGVAASVEGSRDRRA